MKLKVWTTVLLCLMLFCGCPLSIAESVNLIPIESIDTFSFFVSDILHPGYVYVLNTDTPFTPISIDADTLSTAIKEIQQYESEEELHRYYSSIGLPIEDSEMLSFTKCTQKHLHSSTSAFFQEINVLSYQNSVGPIMSFLFIKTQGQWYLWDSFLQLDDPEIIIGDNTIWLRGRTYGEPQRVPRYETEYWYDLIEREITNSFLIEGFYVDLIDYHIFSKAITETVIDNKGVLDSYIITTTISIQENRTQNSDNELTSYDVYSTREVYIESENGLFLKSSSITPY